MNRASVAPSLFLLVVLAMACTSPNYHAAFGVTVVNQSGQKAHLDWRDDAPLATRNSEPIAACALTARGFPPDVRTTIWVGTPANEVSFTIQPGSQSSPTMPSRTVVIRSDGTIDADAPPWPDGQRPC
jgi:hypothetical protein